MEEDSSRILRVGRIQYDQLTPQELHHLCSICLELICVTDDLSPGDKEGEDEEGDDIDTEENDMSAHTCEQREFPHIFHTVCLRQACKALGFQCPVCRRTMQHGIRSDFEDMRT